MRYMRGPLRADKVAVAWLLFSLAIITFALLAAPI
jgi:hypothetical protein